MSEQPTVHLPAPPAPGSDLPAGDDAPTRMPNPPGVLETIAPSDGAFTGPHDLAPPMPAMSMGGGEHPASRAKPEAPKLDGYDVIEPIGEGGMGTVWRGVQLSTRRNVALKLISAAGFASERARQRFDREVEITARLEHPNIARVYDSGINRGVYFYAMELIDGSPLDQYVTAHRLDRTRILRLFAVVCRAVHHAHERGVIHRDLKPGNILVSREGQPHVLDFGLAKALLAAGKEAGISLDGEIAGTPGYMAPEQAAGLADLDARCDVYSLGVILYRLLTGRPPHDLDGTYLDVLRRVSEEEPRRPRLADRTIDPDLDALLLHALQRDPAERYPTAGAMADDIDSYLSGDPISAKPLTTIYFLRKRARKHRVPLAVIGVVVILLTLATQLSLWLVGAHHQTSQEKQKTEQEQQIAEQNRRATEIESGNALIATADDALHRGEWDKARADDLAALEHFRAGGETTAFPFVPGAERADRAAYLALWDLNRRAPPPLLTIVAPKSTSPAAAPNDAGVGVGTIAYLNDNRRALAGCDDGTLRLWDVALGRLLLTIQASRGPVRSVSISGNGRLILSGSADGSLKVWELPDGAMKEQLHLSTSMPKGWGISRVALSPDGRLALSISGASAETMVAPDYNDAVTVWDIAGGKSLYSSDAGKGMLAVKGSITQAAFSPDSTKIIAAGADVAVFNADDGATIARLPGSATAAAFSTDGNYAAAGASDGSVRLLDLASKESALLKPRPGGAIWALLVDPTRRQVLAGTESAAFRAVDFDDRDLWSQPPRGDIGAMAISPDGITAISANDSGLSVWRMTPAPEAPQFAHDGPFASAMLSGDGLLAVSCIARRRSAMSDDAPQAAIWDVATGKQLTPDGFPTRHCRGIAISRDGKTVAMVSGSVLSVWSLDPPGRAGMEEFPAPGGNGTVPVAVSADGKRIAVAAADYSLLIYEVSKFSAPRQCLGHHGPITSICFSPTGDLLSGSEDGTARSWDAIGHDIAVCPHASPVNAVAISDDGKFAVTGSGAPSFQQTNDNSVRLWSFPAGNRMATLSGHTQRVRSVGVSPNAALIASGSDDQSVILWDFARTQALRTVRASEPVACLSFDATGHTLLCAGDTLSVWNLWQPMLALRDQEALGAAHQNVQSRPDDPSVLNAYGLWYALQGHPAWAAPMLQQSQDGRRMDWPLELARCQWLSGDLSAAERNFKLVGAQDAPAFYVKLCIEAMHHRSREVAP